MNKNKKQSGFSLIEVLMVISIITLISSTVFTSVYRARMKARDLKRKQDLIQLKKAIEVYISEKNNAPPDLGGEDTSKGLSASFPTPYGVGNPATESFSGTSMPTALGTLNLVDLPTGSDWAPGGLSDLLTLSSLNIGSLPKDPLQKDFYYYYYEPVGSVGNGGIQYNMFCATPQTCGYIVSAKLEDASDKEANPGCNACETQHNYCVFGGGAKLNSFCYPTNW